MEKYVVVYKRFKDLKDNDYIYKEGDIYPREGLEPTKARIKELASNKNNIGKVLIKKMEEEVKEETEVDETTETKVEE